MPTLTIRPVEPQETALLHDFLRRVAQYEHMEDELICSVDDLRRELFERSSAEAVFACEGDEPVAFAVGTRLKTAPELPLVWVLPWPGIWLPV